jgi:hypothetical protein
MYANKIVTIIICSAVATAFLRGADPHIEPTVYEPPIFWEQPSNSTVTFGPLLSFAQMEFANMKK